MNDHIKKELEKCTSFEEKKKKDQVGSGINKKY